jgi:hypothetical protein
MSIYSTLEYDPFAVAHKLAMPAALFEAFKKTMLAGQSGEKTERKDLEEAIVCLRRHHADYLQGFVAMPEGRAENDTFIDDVMAAYDRRWPEELKQLQNIDHDIGQEAFFKYQSAFDAGAEILRWFYSYQTFTDLPKSCTEQAIAHIESALACCTD